MDHNYFFLPNNYSAHNRLLTKGSCNSLHDLTWGNDFSSLFLICQTDTGILEQNLTFHYPDLDLDKEEDQLIRCIENKLVHLYRGALLFKQQQWKNPQKYWRWGVSCFLLKHLFLQKALHIPTEMGSWVLLWATHALAKALIIHHTMHTIYSIYDRNKNAITVWQKNLSEYSNSVLLQSFFKSRLNDFTGDIWSDGIHTICEFPLLYIFCYSDFIFITESVALSRVLLSLLIFRTDSLLFWDNALTMPIPSSTHLSRSFHKIL